MGVTLLDCGHPMATTLAQPSQEALVTMVNLAAYGLRDAASISCYLTLLVCSAAAETIGVCAEPELAIRNLTPANPFFLIGSDGVFEFMPSQTVVDMVSPSMALRHAVAVFVEVLHTEETLHSSSLRQQGQRSAVTDKFTRYALPTDMSASSWCNHRSANLMTHKRQP